MFHVDNNRVPQYVSKNNTDTGIPKDPSEENMQVKKVF
jgi:hypothetical protein